jgi:hypothetical protein
VAQGGAGTTQPLAALTSLTAVLVAAVLLL